MPRLLFLHGFLGQKEDWEPLLALLPTHISIQAIDLPGHKGKPLSDEVALSIQQEVESADLIVGYSAGGRIALELKERFPEAFGRVIALSAHPGLKTEEEKAQRWALDQTWIHMLEKEPYETFLQKWYQQPLFASFVQTPLFAQTLEARKKQDPHQLARFLQQQSLGKKRAPELFPNQIFAYGEEDLKYGQLYSKLCQFKVFSIENAGHCVHLENPNGCAKIIMEALNEYDRHSSKNGMARDPKVSRHQVP
jgi:2-succinyl-6-hydroxy-2,4-cyclohexadiene-1-carboxylate synthase